MALSSGTRSETSIVRVWSLPRAFIVFLIALVTCFCVASFLAVCGGADYWEVGDDELSAVDLVESDVQEWFDSAPRDFGPDVSTVVARRISHSGAGMAFIFTVGVEPNLDRTTMTEIRTGFPFQSSRGCRYRQIPIVRGAVTKAEFSWAVPMPLRFARDVGEDGVLWFIDSRFIPFGVSWVPLVGNMTIYFVTIYLLMLVPLYLIALWRRIRGRCPRCAYVLSHSSNCSECGWARSSPPPSGGTRDSVLAGDGVDVSDGLESS